MEVEKYANRNSHGRLAAMAVLTSASLLAHAARADQFHWSSIVAHGSAGALVSLQDDTDPQAIFILIPEQQPVIAVPFRVDASQSFDRPDASVPISSYVWNWGDGTANSTGISVLHTYTQAGTYTIKLTVSDAQNNSDEATRTVTVAPAAPPSGTGNRAPTAALSVSPAEGEVGDEFVFDAGGSRDADSDPLTYRFNFGDGHETAFGSSAVVMHTYDQTGNYVVRLTVRDDQNASTDTTRSVHVLGPDEGNQPPVALIATGPRTGAAPATLTFDGRISYDPEGDPLVYEWTFSRDEVLYDSQSGSVVSQLFDEPGTYTVMLEVWDSEGASSSSDEQTVTITQRGVPVEPPPPAPVPTPEPPPPSHEQRPPSSTCGIGVFIPMLACFMGLVARRKVRRPHQ